MLRLLASVAAVAFIATPALAETWHVMGATPAELLMMETDSKIVHPNGNVSVWTSSVKVGEEEEPIVKALWQVNCSGTPSIRPEMVVWFDHDMKTKESWTATKKDGFQPVVPGSRGEMTWQYACGKKAWPISVHGSFGEVAGAYAKSLEKLVAYARQTKEEASLEAQ
jgi:hypothetical protein